MLILSRSPFSTAIWLGVLSIGISLVFFPIASTMGLSHQRETQPRSEIGLEIRLTAESTPIRLAGPHGGGGSAVIHRRSLKINDTQSAGEFTALHVQAEIESDGIRVSLSIIYNDQWDKKEKIGESHLIRIGESIRVSALDQFGIEPLDLKAVDATPVVLKPGEGPRITNTASLEVEKLERHFDSYRVWLKNKSDKNIIVYEISTGRSGMRSGMQIAAGGYGRSGTLLAPGATSSEVQLPDSEIDVSEIAIRLVVFEDGTVEGESKLATQYLAKAEGVRIQSPSVLQRIEETMNVDDSDLRTAFVKLESELWVIPEAMDKPTSIQFLKTKFPAEDEKSISALYEVFKGGLYDGRNIALSSLGETLRTVQGHEERGQPALAVESIRRTLEHLKETFGKITSAQR